MAKAIGRLLLFDTLLGDGTVIPHDCKINIAYKDKVPISLRSFPYEPSDIIGWATVLKDDKGLIFESDFPLEYSIFDTSDMHEMLPGCGGFYNRVKRDGTGKVTEMDLKSIMLTESPVHEDFTWEIKTEEELGCTMYEDLQVGDTFKLCEKGDERVFRKEKEGAIQIRDSSGNHCEKLGHMMYPYIGFPVYKEE